MSEKLLVVLPHPDDEALGIAGTVIQAIKNGAHATYACLTLGEMGRNLGSPFFTTREELPSIRKKELINAANIIGFQDLRMLGYCDKTIEFEDIDTVSSHILSIINELQPTKIYTFYPGYAVHPDHDATGAAVIHAVQSLPKDKRPTVYCVAFAKNVVKDLGNPHIVNDVSSVYEQKFEAVRAHESQVFGLLNLANRNIDEAKQSNDMIQRLKREAFWIYDFKD